MATAEHKSRTFTLAEVEPFDARRGYKRCNPPGVGVSFGRGASANSDFWRDRAGNLFVRFSSIGYVYHLQALRIDGNLISAKDMDDLIEYIVSALQSWIIEGVDDSPISCIDY